MMGYLVELKEKNGFFDTEGEYKKVLMTGEVLSEYLIKPSRCCIFSAVSVDLDEYQANHSKCSRHDRSLEQAVKIKKELEKLH